MKRQEVIIKSNGVMLEYRAPFLYCHIENETKKVNSASISSIKLMEECILKSSVFDMVNKYDITISFQNGKSQPIARCTPFFMKMDIDAYKSQLLHSSDSLLLKKMSLIWLHQKHEERRKLIDRCVKSIPDTEWEKYNKAWFENIADGMDQSQSEILSKEAHSTKIYWKLYNKCIPREMRFKTRTKNPGEDLTNIILNYTYGIFYSMIEKSIVACGLDPFIGIFHVDGPGRKSLVYDMIEAHRHEAKQFVLSYIKKEVKILQGYVFKTNFLPKELKSSLINEWKEYNKLHKISTKIMTSVEEFKTYLVNIHNEDR